MKSNTKKMLFVGGALLFGGFVAYKFGLLDGIFGKKQESKAPYQPEPDLGPVTAEAPKADAPKNTGVATQTSAGGGVIAYDTADYSPAKPANTFTASLGAL